ncbi:MAG: heparinase II/III family protein [Planctomycetota bacterium]
MARCACEIEAIVEFEDFHPAHYLDVAEMGAGLAMAYHWLGDRLGNELRVRVCQALGRHVLEPADESYFWWRAETNWNSVCLAGLAISASVVRESDPESAAAMMERVRSHMHHGFAAYEEGGVYPEGPTYWTYGTTFAVLLLECLDWMDGAGDRSPLPPPFAKTAEFRGWCDGTSDRVFNYGDAHVERCWFEPALLWFVDRLGAEAVGVNLKVALRRLLTGEEMSQTTIDRLYPLALLWCSSTEAASSKAEPSWLGGRKCPLWFYRDADSGFYVAAKGGSGATNHAHLDVGSFVMDLRGTRFASDLGAENYVRIERKVRTLFEHDAASDRWTLLRHRNEFHNTLTIGSRLHKPEGYAAIERIDAGDHSGIEIDLTDALSSGCSRAVRRIVVVGPNELVIEDDVDLPVDETVFTLVTTADVREMKRGCDLSIDGVEAELRIEGDTPSRIEIDEIDAHRCDHEATNPGMRRVRVVYGQTERVRSRVRFATREGGLLPA